MHVSGVFIPLLLSHFFFFKSHSYSRGALRAWADQFNASQCSCRRHRRRLCLTYLLFSFSVKFQLPIVREWSRFASCHPPFPVMHVQSVRPLVPLVPPVPGGGGTARSQASFPNSRHWRFVLSFSPSFFNFKGCHSINNTCFSYCRK